MIRRISIVIATLAITLAVAQAAEGAITVSGTAYQNDEATDVGDGVNTYNVALRVNGGAASTTTTDIDTGAFSFSDISVNAGDTITIYFYGASDTTAGTYTGNFVTITDGSTAISSVTLYDDHLVVRSDNSTTAITIDDLVDYDNDQNSANLLFDAENATPDTLSIESGVELFIPTGEPFTPGGNVTVGSGGLDLNGTWTESGTETLTIGGDFDSTGGTFTKATGTVKFTVTSTITGSQTFNNVEFYALSHSTFTIADGTTLTVDGTLTLSGTHRVTLDTGTIDAKGDITITNTNTSGGGTATINICGTGNQILTGQGTVNTGRLPKVIINKASGNLTLSSLISVAGNWTYTSMGTGSLITTDSTVAFVGTPTPTITGSHTLNNVEFYASSNSTFTIADGTTLTVDGTLTLSGLYRLILDTGTIDAKGDITITNTNENGGGSATINICGTGNQILTGPGTAKYGKLPNIVINKSSGTLTLDSIISVAGGNWTYTSMGTGSLITTDSTVAFFRNLTITGSHTLNNVEFYATGNETFTIADGTTLTVDGTLTLSGTNALTLNTGTIDAKGDITVTNIDQRGGGSATINICGTGNQILTGQGTAKYGNLPNIVINKSSGTLTLDSIISVAGNWTYTQGTVDATTNDSTVVFYGTKNLDGQGTSATMAFDNVQIGDDLTSTSITLAGNLDVNGNLTISSSRTLNTSGSNYSVNVAGNWTNSGTFTSNSSVVTFDTNSTATIDTGGVAAGNDFQTLTIDKSGGSLQLTTNHLDVDGTLTITAGTLDLNSLNISTTTNLDVSGTLKLTGDETVSDPDPTLNTNSTVEYSATSSSRAIKTWTYTNATVKLNGTGGTFTLPSALTCAGINIAAGTFTPGYDINVSGNWAKTGGTFNAGSNTVTFNGTNQTISGSTTFNNFTKTESADDSLDETLTFDNTGTQTIGGLLTLDGRDDDDRINLVSDDPVTPEQWSLIATGTFAIDYIEVTDSDASGGSTVTMTDRTNCIDGGNNLNWGFNTAPVSSSITGSQQTSGAHQGDIAISYTATDADSGACNLNTAGDPTAAASNQIQYAPDPYSSWTNCTIDSASTVSGITAASSGTAHSGDLWWDVQTDLSGVSGNYKVRMKLHDGTEYEASYAESSAFSVDTVGPTLDSIAWADVDSSNTLTENDTLTFTFSEAMDTSTVDNAGLANDVDTVLAPSSGNYGASGAKSVSWTNNTTVVVTLGGSPTISRNATVNPTAAVTDAAGNSDNTTSNSGNGPSFVDPYGVVFDSLTNNPIQGATVTIFTSAGVQCTRGDQIASTDTNPQTTSSTGEYSFLCDNGDYYITVSATGYTYPSTKTSFPSGRTITTGSKGETFTISGTVLEIDQPLDSSSALLTVSKDANKKEVNIGDILTYTVTIQNPTSSDITAVYLEDNIPPGLKYLSDRVTLDGSNIANPTGTRPLTFNIGTVSAGTTRILKYQLVVGSGVALGNYENTAWAKYSDGTVISNQASETVKVILEPLFDLGMVIGKVFWDFNENGKQDSLDVRRPMLDAKTSNIQHLTSNKDEFGIANVQIATEDGTLITTDKDGKYHLPAIIPGRHLFRVDERTLPEGAYLTTDKVVIVDITPGILAKVNFGVNSKDKEQKTEDRSQKTETPVKIMQERTKPTPRLNIASFSLADNQYEFRLFTNYSLFIEKWKLETLDKDTKALVKKFEGTRLTINEPILWDGKDKNGRPLNPERNYVYVLTVTGKDGREDVTRERDIKVSQLTSEPVSQLEKEIERERQKWIEQESKVNNLEKQNIRIEGETISVHSIQQSAVNSIRVIKGEKLEGEILVVQPGGLTAKDLLESQSGKGIDEQSEVEIILPKGEYDIQVIYEELDVRRRMLDAKTEGGESGVSVREAGGMAEGNGFDGEGIQNNEEFSRQGAIRDDIPVTESGGLNTAEHSRGQGSLSQQGIHSVPLSGEGLSVRSDNASQDSGQTSVPQGGRNREFAESLQRDSSKNQQSNQFNKEVASNIQHLTSNKVYSKHVKIGEDYLFFVAMGDAKMGYTFNRGNIEPVQQDDKFKPGFWSEGKLAYYLKGRIKGKYLLTSSLETQRDKKELFRNLDPDKHYPVYGDSSSINYDATNTQGALYLLVEWDKSSAIWGNYHTAFTDTEFAAFSRTLYGGKLHYESVSTTQFGEPRTKLLVFRARAQQKAAHNEFIGTGGSLFYLKNKDVIEGSDKVKIEVRDKITALVLTTTQMQEGSDYEIDYANGRLTFWQPISYIVESDSLISSSLLDGNPVYVVVDYEYEVKDKYDQASVGARLQKSLSDYLTIGGTYLKEEQLDKNYELKGADTILHLGKDITLTGEYAQSESEAQGSFISTDGGLSFTELATADADRGQAYGIKAKAQLFDRLGLTSYYKQIEKGFSSASTTSQQGKELIGAGATFDLSPKTRIKATHDIQKLIDDGNLQTQLQVGAKQTETTTAQITHEATEKLKLTGEYRHQAVEERKQQFASETNTAEDIAAIRADYKATDKLTVSLEQQATLKGSPNHQTSAGINAKVNERLSLRAKETIGTQGTATGIGATVYPTRGKDSNRTNIKDSFEVSTDYTRANYKSGGTSDTASLSGKAKLDEKTQVYTTIAVTDSSAEGLTQSLVFGSERKLNEELTLASNKTYAQSRDNLTQANTFGLTKEKDGKRLEGTFSEQKSQSDTEVSNTNIFALSGDINDNWAAQGSFERGKVQNHDGTLSARNAGSVGLGFVDKDEQTQSIRLKASSKLELRLDDGQEDKRQYLVYNAVEGKINPNTTLFAKANLSQTKNKTTDSTEAQYKELVTGLAYRPVNLDRLNLLGKYTYLEDDSPSGQTDISDIEKEQSHTLAAEAVYDLTDKWQLVEKLAYKMGEEKVSGFDVSKTQSWLNITRLNFHPQRDWQAGLEYRRLTQDEARDVKQGALVEVSRKLGEFMQLGTGYNFTDFSDDLTHLDYTSHGPFIRLTAKLYDRTPEEIERARKRAFERRIESILKERLRRRFMQEEAKERETILALYHQANNLYEQRHLVKAEAKFSQTLQLINKIEVDERVRIDTIVEKEDNINSLYQKANSLYKENRTKEAAKYYNQCLEEIEILNK